MIDWQSPKVDPPPQGVKILWFSNGDVFVAQRLGQKYICLQPGEVNILPEPKLYRICPIPAPYEGRMGIKIDNEMMTIDEMEVKHPKEYQEFIAAIPPSGKFK